MRRSEAPNHRGRWLRNRLERRSAHVQMQSVRLTYASQSTMFVEMDDRSEIDVVPRCLRQLSRETMACAFRYRAAHHRTEDPIPAFTALFADIDSARRNVLA